VKLRVGTRRSPLALTQTGQALDELSRRVPGLEWELVEVVTSGDRIQDRPLREAGGKGLFLKELDEALLAGRIDCAVHSLKDVPTDLAPATAIAAVLERADARDVLVTARGLSLEELAPDAAIGTTSLRRQAQALAKIPRARIGLLRGNVETRLGRVTGGDFDATFLAAAGLARLGLSTAPAVGLPLDPFAFVPAAGQGALAITAREHDAAVLEVLATMNHAPSRTAAAAERGFARVFGGGCHLPLAAYGEVRRRELCLVGLVLSPDGSRGLREEGRVELVGEAEEDEARARRLGESLARACFERGAAAILAQAEAAAGTAP
jgi:hydroxymethylbilane synthase